MKDKFVDVRSRDKGELGSMPFDDFLNQLKEEIETKGKKVVGKGIPRIEKDKIKE